MSSQDLRAVANSALALIAIVVALPAHAASGEARTHRMEALDGTVVALTVPAGWRVNDGLPGNTVGLVPPKLRERPGEELLLTPMPHLRERATAKEVLEQTAATSESGFEWSEIESLAGAEARGWFARIIDHGSKPKRDDFAHLMNAVVEVGGTVLVNATLFMHADDAGRRETALDVLRGLRVVELPRESPATSPFPSPEPTVPATAGELRVPLPRDGGDVVLELPPGMTVTDASRDLGLRRNARAVAGPWIVSIDVDHSDRRTGKAFARELRQFLHAAPVVNVERHRLGAWKVTKFDTPASMGPGGERHHAIALRVVGRTGVWVHVSRADWVAERDRKLLDGLIERVRIEESEDG